MRGVHFLLAAASVLVFGLTGCGNGDDGAQEAIRLVQQFQPSNSAAPISVRLNKAFSNEEWVVSKTTEGMYRVTYRGSKSGQSKELVFGVTISDKRVMALNRDALAFTNPM